MISTYFLAAAMALQLAAGAHYFSAVVRGRARPNPVSWFCWGLTPLVAFDAQLTRGLRPTEWMTLVLAIGPLAIVVAAVVKNGLRGRVSRFDVACGGLALVGLLAWHATSRPAVALLFSIVADLVAAVPTFRNGYRHPLDECALPYLVSAVAMVVTLLTVHRWVFGQVGLPLYILLVNVALYLVVRLRTAAVATKSTVDDQSVRGVGGVWYSSSVTSEPHSLSGPSPGASHMAR